MNNNNPPIILDLGNVLLKLDFYRFVDCAAAKTARPRDEIYDRYIAGERKRAFETGRTPADEFFGEMAAWLEWPEKNLEGLVHCWNDIFDDMPEATRGVEALAKARPLWLMSDTNEAHFEYVVLRWPFFGLFERCFTSYTTGRMKSEVAAFDPVVRALPQRNGVLFFDDIPGYVSNARQAGLDAHVFRSWDEIMEKAGMRR